MQGVGKVTGTVLISAIVGLFFCTSTFPFKSTLSLRLILLFPSLQKKELCAEGQFSFMYSSQEGIRPYSRNYWTSCKWSWKSCSHLLQTPEVWKVQTVFVYSTDKLNTYLNWNELQKLLGIRDHYGRYLKKRDYHKLTSVCACMHIFVQIGKHTVIH